MPDETRLIETLARERLDLADATVLGPLHGGVNGRSYLVAARRGRYAVKRIEQGSRLVDLETEFALLERLAGLGVAPRPVALDVAEGLLATELITGAEPLTPAEVREPAEIARIAALLARLHSVVPALPAFAPEAYAGRYLAGLGGIGALPPGERARFATLLELAADFRARYAPVAFCHNDLVAANLVRGPAGLLLVDFEYAVAAPPVLDLASVAVMNGFGPAEEARLVEAYHAPRRAPFSPSEFAKVRRLVALLAHFWARARAAAGDDRVDAYIERDR